MSRFVEEAGETAEITASRRDRAWRDLPPPARVPGELEPVHGPARRPDGGADAGAARPPGAASGELDTLLHTAAALRGRAPPGLQGARRGVGGRPARRADDRTRRSRSSASWPRTRPRLAKPLRQFLQTIDDRAARRRARPARGGDRPAGGDKTHTTSSRAGFTGMEAIWNYFYWQALPPTRSTTSATCCGSASIVNDCSQYPVKPSKALLNKCNQFLGPTQPGVTTPDPTTGSPPRPPPRRRPRRAGGRLAGGRLPAAPGSGVPGARPRRRRPASRRPPA